MADTVPPQYLGPGPGHANCVGDALGVDHHVDPLAWWRFFEPCARRGATHVGFVAPHPHQSARIDDPEGLAHVATLSSPGADLASSWVTGILGIGIGRYRSTVGQLTDGLVLAPGDRTGRLRAGASADQWSGLELRQARVAGGAGLVERLRVTVSYDNPVWLKRTGRVPRRTAWYADNTFVSWEIADLVRRYTADIRWRDPDAGRARVVTPGWGGRSRAQHFPPHPHRPLLERFANAWEATDAPRRRPS